MSKKTFFKRVSLIAISALSFGSLSVTPSQALISGHELFIGASGTTPASSSYSQSISVGETATAVLRHSFAMNAARESVTVSVTRITPGTGTVKLQLTDSSTGRSETADPAYYSDPATNLMTPASGSLIGTRNEDVTTYYVTDTGVTSSGTGISTTLNVHFQAPSVAGTYRFVVGASTNAGLGASTDGVGGPSVSWTVTVTAADTVATSASTAILRTGTELIASGTANTDSSVVAARSALTTRTPAATIWVTQRNATSTASESMTVVVSGPALVTTDSTAAPTAGTAITVRNGGLSNLYNYGAGVTPVFVYSNGTAGKATITVTTLTGLLIGTETVTFTGPVTNIATEYVDRKILRAGGGTNGSSQSTIGIRATDANGNGVALLDFSMVSSATNVVSSISSAACTHDASDPGYYACTASTTAGSASGQSATLTYRVQDPAVTSSVTYFTVTHDVTLGGAASTWTFAADKATYQPGEAMILTATAVDASGNPASDGAAGPTFLVANKNLGGTSLATVFNSLYDGKSTTQIRSALDPRTFRTDNTLFAPAASGKFLLAGTYGTGNAKSASIELTVGDDAATTAASAATDAALEAIDAANAATDAANLAAEAADAATVAAEEARDAADAATAAVEALATEVATLMAALKAQITTLANTVAKIAKRVRA